MAELKNKEEYEKWKAEKAKKSQKETDESSKTQLPDSRNAVKISKKLVVAIIGLLIVLTAVIALLLATRSNTSTANLPASIMNPFPTGKITGNIFVSMKSGDIKKGAGITVTLLKNQDTILNGFLQIQQETTQFLPEVSQALHEVKKLQATDFIKSKNMWNDTVMWKKQPKIDHLR